MELITLALTALLLGGSHVPERQPAARPCVMAKAELQWVDGAFRAWEFVRTKKLHIAPAPLPAILLFDAHCRYDAPGGGNLRWTGKQHGGKILLPDGSSMTPAVTTFTSVDDKTGKPFFVMALPSVWRAANMKAALGLETLIHSVFLHEFMHTRQAYFVPLFNIPDKVGDDSLQGHFENNPEYVAAYERERDLLYAAAAEPDRARALASAREALAAMRTRQARWFTGENAYWKRADDLFLTMEGSGQWTPYAWLTDHRGRGIDSAIAVREMRRNKKWWSQEEGLALFLVIDRFLPGWQQKVFARRPVAGVDLLALAVGGT